MAKVEYVGCDCAAQRAELTGGDGRLTVHCLRLNDYRSFADAGAAGPNLNPKMAELYQKEHGGIPQYQYDALRGANLPVGVAQLQRKLSSKARAPDAQGWVFRYNEARSKGQTVIEAANAADAGASEGVLQGQPKAKTSTTPVAPVLDAQGNVVPPEPRHHAARFIGLIERAQHAIDKAREGMAELHRLNPPVSGTDEAKALFRELADLVVDCAEMSDVCKGIDGVLKALPSTINVEAPKIEPKAGGWCLAREKYHAELADQLNVEVAAMPELRLLILSVTGNGVVCCDPVSPLDRVFAPSTSLLVVAEPDAESIAKADECRSVKRARRGA